MVSRLAILFSLMANPVKPDDATRVVQSDTYRGRVERAHKSPPSLVCLIGPESLVGQQWYLEGSEIILGRAPHLSISITDQSLSRNHALFHVNSQEVLLEDLGSTNKTYVNDKMLPARRPYQLKDNDQIKAGNIVFKFLDSGNLESVTQKENYIKANFDALTEIFNRGALNSRGPEALKRAIVLEEDLSLVVFDIDHFKSINDRFGHDAGDYVLKTLAQSVQSHVIREFDFFARYGGEEFVILLGSSDLDKAEKIAERTRLHVEGTAFQYEGQRIPVTISLGVTSLKGRTIDWQSLFKEADQALYKAKNSGRNRVQTAG